MAEFDIVLIAGIALFIAYQLYKALGTRTGHERSREDRLSEGRDRPAPQPLPGNTRDETRDAPVVAAPRKNDLGPRPRPPLVDPSTALGQTLAEIEAIDRRFIAAEFLDGAKIAHEMIVQAFAAGDTKALRPLLADDVFESFAGAIAARQKAGLKTEFAFVGLRSAELSEAHLKGGRIAELTVRFVTELISATRDTAGAVVEGVAGVVREVTDVWTFARDTRSSDPNWKLVATAA